MKKRNWNKTPVEELKNQVIDLYQNTNLTKHQIAKKIYKRVNFVTTVLKEHNIKDKEFKHRRWVKRCNIPTKEELELLYINMTVEQLAEKFRVSKSSINRLTSEYKIKNSQSPKLQMF